MGRHRVKPRKDRGTYLTMTPGGMSPHESLAMAIIRQAVHDAEALAGKRTLEYNAQAGQVSKWELINFFRSGWCNILLGTTSLTGEDFIERTELENAPEIYTG